LELALGLKILYVEDHADTRFVMSKAMRKWGHDVQSAASAAEARAICEADVFDVLLCDIGLPDEEGTILLEERPSGRSWRYAVALTAFGMNHEVERFRQAGFDEVLVKPVLSEALAAALGRARGIHHAPEATTTEARPTA
jgi:CheY-like chemotaxis protein